MKRFVLLLPIVASFFAPSIALAAAPRTFAELADVLVSLIDTAAGMLVVLGIVIYFYGVSTNILKMHGESGQKVRAYMVWGVLVLFIMVSIWGILQLLQTTLFGNDAQNPTTGTHAPAGATFQAPAFRE
jgi:hypothetical protein